MYGRCKSFGKDLLRGYFVGGLMSNWLALFDAYRGRLIKLIFAVFAPIVIVFVDLIPEASVGLGSLPLLLDELQSLKRIPVLGSNQVSNNNSNRAWDSSMAMNENIKFILPLFANPSNCIIKMLNDGVFHSILDRKYFMAIDGTVDRNF